MNNLNLLVKAAATGDKKAFEEIYKLKHKQVYFTCLAFLKDEHDAEDVSQEVYIAVMKNLASLKEESRFENWLSRVTVNKCKDFVKKKKPIPVEDELLTDLKEADGELLLSEEYIINEEKRKIIMNLIRESLMDVLYQTVVLFYFNEFTIKEIAEVMECPQGTVAYRLNTARARIKEAVLKYEKDKGEKLYSVALVPVLAAVLLGEAMAMQPVNICASVMTAASGNLGVAAKAAEAGGKTMLKTLKAKIIAGILGLVLVGGGITAAVVISGDSKDDKSDKRIENVKDDEDDVAGVLDDEDSLESGNDLENGKEPDNGEVQVPDDEENGDDEDWEEEEMTPEQLDAVQNRVDALFTALQAGDIETLIELCAPESEAMEVLEEIKDKEYAEDLFVTLFQNMAWTYTEENIEEWESELLWEYEEDEEDTSLELMYSVPAMLLFKEFYLNTFTEGTVVPEDISLSGNQDALNVLEQILPYIPMWSREYIDITIPDENGDFYFILDDLFDTLEFDDLGTGNSYLRYYVEELCWMACDARIGGEGSQYDEYNDELIQIHEFLEDKDFEGLQEWYDDYMGTDYETEYAESYGSYDELTDSQKEWLDNFIEEEVEYIHVDYTSLGSNGERRESTFILVYPSLDFYEEELGEWIIENDVSEFQVSYSGIADMDEFSSYLFAYYYYMINYAGNYIE